MKFTYVICSALCALVVGTVSASASTSVGDGDPFELTFNASGSGNLDACTFACTTGPITGTAVTNAGGLGGNGFSFTLPQVVGGGYVEVLNSSNVLAGILDFSGSTMDFLTSGTLSNYATSLTVTASANGSFTFNAGGVSYPANNQYNGTLPTATPEPSSLALLGSGFVALVGFVGRRRRRE